MPTSHYKWGFKMPTKKTKTEPKERHTVGPHGEKRSLSVSVLSGRGRVG